MERISVNDSPEACASAGFLYNIRNSNNPATAKVKVSVGFSGMAVYNFKIGRLPLTLRYQASLPVFGVFFLRITASLIMKYSGWETVTVW